MNKLMNYLNMIVKFFVFLSIFTMAAVVIMQVFFRFVLQNSLSWPVEFSKILFIYLVFIGGALASKRKEHIYIEILDHFTIPEKVQNILEIVRQSLIFILMLIIMNGAYKLIPISSAMSMSATGLPRSIMIYPIFIGGFLMGVWSLIYIVDNIKLLFSKQDK